MNLIFDIDDTLYDLMEPFERAFKEMKYDRYADCYKVFEVSRKYADQLYSKMEQGEITADEYFILRTQKAMESVGIQISDHEALEFKKKYRNYQGNISMSDTMIQILEIAKAKFSKIGIISNGILEGQWKKLEVIGALKWIPKEMILISQEVKVAKPDVRIFQYATEKFQISPEETIYVGDTYLNDIVGASRANWQTIWLNKRRQDISGKKNLANYIVYTEEELKNLIERL